MNFVNIITSKQLDSKSIETLKDNAMLKVNPHLWIEWDFDKNELDIYKATKGSDKIVSWVCKDCNNIYDKKIELRNRGLGCPICKGKGASELKNLEKQRPDLLDIWDYELNELKPSEVTLGMAKKVWWKCHKCEESYPMEVNKKVNGRGCSICAGYRVTEKSSLKGFFPEIAEEWNHLKNGTLKPNQVSKRSGKKVWWKCKKCNFEYQMTIDKRTDPKNNNTKCKNCSDKLSFGEKVIYSFLRNNYINFEMEKCFEWSNKKRYDFYIEELNLIIEVHGEQHFNGSFSRLGGRSLEEEMKNDEFKKQMAFNNGIKHYVVLKSLNMSLESIKAELNNSELITLLNLDKEVVSKLTLENLANLTELTWSMKKEGFNNTKIANLLKIDRHTVGRYVKLGKEMGIM